MTAPDYVIRPAFGTAHSNMPKTNQIQMPSQDKMDQFNQWNQNIAGKTDLANGNIPVSGTGITGTVRTNSVGIAPATSVALLAANMLVSQNFTSPSTMSVSVLDRWSWDGTDGNLTLGCARVDCDGTQLDLVSNEIPVIVGETIEVACQVKWENITYTGTHPIVLGVEKYRKGRDPVTGGVTYLDLGGVDVDSVESPVANSDWEESQLAGTYVVEPGVDQLRFRFRAARTIIDGIVKWDEAIFLKLDLIDDAAVPGVGTTVDNIVQQLYGAEGDSFTHNEAAVALGNTSATLMAVNARLSALEAGTFTGAIAGDDFLWIGEITANVNWGGSYSRSQYFGHYDANGQDAVFTPTGASGSDTTQECMFDWQGTDTVSDTDYQLVQLLLASAPTTSPDGNFKSYIYLFGRVATGFASYIRARFGSDGTYSIGYKSGGAFVEMASGTCTVPGMGSLLSLYCGNVGTTSPRRFKLMMNSIIIAEFDEVGTGSTFGASNRKWGWGGETQGGVFPVLLIFLTQAQAAMPRVNQWLGYDQ